MYKMIKGYSENGKFEYPVQRMTAYDKASFKAQVLANGYHIIDEATLVIDSNGGHGYSAEYSYVQGEDDTGKPGTDVFTDGHMCCYRCTDCKDVTWGFDDGGGFVYCETCEDGECD